MCELMLELKERDMLPGLTFHLNAFEAIRLFQVRKPTDLLPTELLPTNLLPYDLPSSYVLAGNTTSDTVH